MPWVHIEDIVGLIDFLLHQPAASGPIMPARRSRCATVISPRRWAGLHRPTLLGVPAFALRMLLGELAVLLLGGQRHPKRLLEAGFVFRYNDFRLPSPMSGASLMGAVLPRFPKDDA
jgi:NAD dependent epimerase/dehydratase family enzyme